MALTKVTGQVINNSTGLVVGVTTVGGGISATDGFFSGIVTAVGDASFSGNVSVGGTLTYEDVTNIDAVGLITARNGIVVGSGITLSKDGDGFFTGVVTATSYAGDGSALTGMASTDNVRTGILDVAGVGTFRNDVNIPDKIIHLGDTDTAIRFPAADTVSVETGGSERARIDSSGRLLVGHNASIGADRHIQLVGNSADESTIEVIRQSADANAPKIDLTKSRNATKGSNTVVQNSDSLGEIHFRGDDGSDLFSAGATIVGVVDGTPGNNSVPGALLFRTTAQGEASTTERLRITNAGAIGLSGTNYGTSGQVLTSGGSGSAVSWAAAGGISMAQHWRITGDVQGNQTPLTNWEAADSYGAGSLGSAMSVSSGIFTFPSTGIYFVLFTLIGYSNSSTQNVIGYIQYTSDNGSTGYDTVSYGANGIYDYSNSYPSWGNTVCQYIFDITDTSNQKLRFVYGAGQGAEYAKGDSNISYTSVTFIRLGDT